MDNPPEPVGLDEELHARPNGSRVIRSLAERWTAIVAISISVASLVIAVMNGSAMDRLVKANSWPFLEFDTGNVLEDRRQHALTLTIKNSGVGPARLETLQVALDGQNYGNSRELIKACCSPAGSPSTNAFGSIITSTVAPRTIPANKAIEFFYWPKPETASPEWDGLDRARMRLKFKACYCSVFDECWTSNLTGAKPEEVKACEAHGEKLYQE
jgi:hypothetical protein